MFIFSCEFIKDAIFFIFCRGFLCFQEQGYIHMCIYIPHLKQVENTILKSSSNTHHTAYAL